MPKNNDDPFRQAIRNIVKDILREEELELTKEDVEKIIQESMPDFDRMISDKIKQHLYELGDFLIKKFEQ
jgi:DNA polymerase III delta prime subunit